jgi:predicted extracellular nuclease
MLRNIQILGYVAGLMIVLVAGSARAAVVIQEVLYDGPGTDADDVFTELYGDPGTSLDGWSLVGINGSDGNVYRTIDLTGSVIPADGLFVIVTGSASPALAALGDLVANIDWQNGPDALQLFDSGLLIDALQYGDAGINNAGEGDFAPDVSGTISLSRNSLALDTNNNAVDFSAAAPTPGAGVSVVPLPAAAWLFVSALALLRVMHKKRP